MALYEHLGRQAVDKVTGFCGTITGYSEYITGCGQVLVQPRVKEGGERIEACWFDEVRLEISGAALVLPEHAEDGREYAAGPCDPAPIR